MGKQGMNTPDNKALGSCSDDKTVRVWDTATGNEIRSFNTSEQIGGMEMTKDREIFVCGGEDLKLYKFDYQTGIEIENFKGHFGPVHCVRFSPDGELYASGSEDGTLRLWQTQVGKTYGLWKCVDSVSGEAVVTSKQETVS